MSPKPTSEPTSPSAAYRTAIRLLEHRDRSVKDVRDRLVSGGFDAEVVDATVARLEGDGFLNDTRFAERYVESVRASRGYGSTRLRADLVRRGIDPELAVAASHSESGTEADRARELALKRVASFPMDLPREAALRRVAGYLARKGYGSATVWDAARRAVEGRE